MFFLDLDEPIRVEFTHYEESIRPGESIQVTLRGASLIRDIHGSHQAREVVLGYVASEEEGVGLAREQIRKESAIRKEAARVRKIKERVTKKVEIPISVVLD